MTKGVKKNDNKKRFSWGPTMGALYVLYLLYVQPKRSRLAGWRTEYLQSCRVGYNTLREAREIESLDH